MSDMNRLPAAARYQRDPLFSALVDTISSMIEHADYTPTELREAVILAATKVEQRRMTWTSDPFAEYRGDPPATRANPFADILTSDTKASKKTDQS